MPLLRALLTLMVRTRLPVRLRDPKRMWGRFQIYVLGSMPNPRQ